MSLTCHEEIGRVGRVGRGCYTRMLANYRQRVVRGVRKLDDISVRTVYH